MEGLGRAGQGWAGLGCADLDPGREILRSGSWLLEKLLGDKVWQFQNGWWAVDGRQKQNHPSLFKCVPAASEAGIDFTVPLRSAASAGY